MMNAQTPAPVPMVKETILKDDGRYLSYYTFPPEAPQPPILGEKETEDADV